MIGIVVVTHGNIGKEMVAATKRIIPDATKLVGVAVGSDRPPADTREEIRKAIEESRTDEGVLLLTDMFGGTPSNICLSFLDGEKIEIVSGVNLPMLIKLASMRSGSISFSDVISFIQEYGQRNIVRASHVLGGKVNEKV